eukprot:gene6485-9359_t
MAIVACIIAIRTHLQLSQRKFPMRTPSMGDHVDGDFQNLPVEDFIMNFLMKHNMTKTMDAFQIEWHILNGQEEKDSVPSVYVELEQLRNELRHCKEVCTQYQSISSSSDEQLEKLRKERDYHRTGHRRMLQEKKSISQEMKRLYRKVDENQRTINELKEKHNTAIREKMLVKLKYNKATSLAEKTLQQATQLSAVNNDTLQPSNFQAEQKSLRATKRFPSPKLVSTSKMASTLPRPEQLLPPPAARPLSPQRASALTIVNTIKASSCAVSALSLHPDGELVASVDDAGVLSLWQLPGGQLEQQVAAHSSWLSDVRFHPDGSLLLTSGSHPKIDLWSTAGFVCMLCIVSSFSEHAHCVWSCDFHHSGDFAASASMDNCIKIWDLRTGLCIHTARHHTDSVNVVRFQPHSNYIVSGSSDRKLIVTDARTGLKSSTMTGHENAISDVAFTYAGDIVVSCDLQGVVIAWTMRDSKQTHIQDVGPHPANCVAIDPAGSVVAVGTGAGSIKLLSLPSLDLVAE